MSNHSFIISGVKQQDLKFEASLGRIVRETLFQKGLEKWLGGGALSVLVEDGVQSPAPTGDAQLSVTPVPGVLIPSSGPKCTRHICDVQTYMQGKHLYIK